MGLRVMACFSLARNGIHFVQNFFKTQFRIWKKRHHPHHPITAFSLSSNHRGGYPQFVFSTSAPPNKHNYYNYNYYTALLLSIMIHSNLFLRVVGDGCEYLLLRTTRKKTGSRFTNWIAFLEEAKTSRNPQPHHPNGSEALQIKKKLNSQNEFVEMNKMPTYDKQETDKIYEKVRY